MNELTILKKLGGILVDDKTSVLLMYQCYLEQINVRTDRICDNINLFIVKQN